MKQFVFCFLIICSLACAETPSPSSQTLVLYNNKDVMSEHLAHLYAKKRDIPKEHIVGVECSIEEEISREEYETTIASPLRKLFTEKGWWTVQESWLSDPRIIFNKIRFVAVMRGIPLKIARSIDPATISSEVAPQFRAINEASVDSELAALGYLSTIFSGPLKNPYFQHSSTIMDFDYPMLMLVCRLDAPTGKTVERMMEDSLSAEQKGLSGFAYVDARNLTTADNLKSGEEWITKAAQNLRRNGIPVVFDNNPATFPKNYPMTNAIFYYGWYDENANGPLSNDDFQFLPGAIAYHLHSFSGATLRNPTRFWIAPLLLHGATATVGNVYEPYLKLTLQIDTFHQRLASGLTFAESAYASLEGVSWMTTVVGDPLYRPFAKQPETEEPWSIYREGAQLWFNKNRRDGENFLREKAGNLKNGMLWEGLGQLQADAGDFTSAEESFQKARKFYKKPDDKIRAALQEIDILRNTKRSQAALRLAQQLTKEFDTNPSAEALRMIVVSLTPKPSPTPSPSNNVIQSR